MHIDPFLHVRHLGPRATIKKHCGSSRLSTRSPSLSQVARADPPRSGFDLHSHCHTVQVPLQTRVAPGRVNAAILRQTRPLLARGARPTTSVHQSHANSSSGLVEVRPCCHSQFFVSALSLLYTACLRLNPIAVGNQIVGGLLNLIGRQLRFASRGGHIVHRWKGVIGSTSG
jgi:hypothetical protein